MGIEFFTNEKKTENEEVDIASPAFSSTKVLAVFGAAITAALGAVPVAVKDDPAVVVAAIAAGTLILLGMFSLVAVDMGTRQKAAEATLRYGAGKTSAAEFDAMPTKDLILQMGPNGDEYKAKYASVKDGQVHIYADREGDPKAASFKESPKPE